MVKERRDIISAGENIPGKSRKHQLPGTVSVMLKKDYGNLLLHYFKGNGFDIRYSNYFGSKEWDISFVNEFKELANQPSPISYLPFVNTREGIPESLDYHTFGIYFSREILQPYAACCRTLAEFIDKAEEGKPANMLSLIRFITPQMMRIVKAMLDYKFHEGLAANYFTGLVHELLILIAIQVSAIAGAPRFSDLELDKAREVRKIITGDFEAYHTVEQLARKVMTSESKLQLAFKHLFGTTVFKFSREARMEEGYKILEATNLPLKVVCMMVGYDDPSNFSVAFWKHYGYWPGQIQKRKNQ